MSTINQNKSVEKETKTNNINNKFNAHLNRMNELTIAIKEKVNLINTQYEEKSPTGQCEPTPQADDFLSEINLKLGVLDRYNNRLEEIYKILAEII